MHDSLSDTVRCAVAQHLDVQSSDIRPTHHLERDLGLHPLDIVLIALRLEEVEHVELPIDELNDVHKVADLTGLLRAVIANDNHGAIDEGEMRRRRRAHRPRPVLRSYRRCG
jgi:acyl carrier protein